MAETAATAEPRPLAIVDHPITSILLPVPVVCFLGALVTDLSYLNSGGNLMWVDFSAWLLAAGLLFGGIALVVLPDPVEELVAAVGVPKVVGWKQGETPIVPKGFHIEALATGLSNPRRVYPLPNGDILIVETDRQGSEPVDRPKDPIRDFIMTMAHGGGGGKETAGAGAGTPQRITLLRDADGDGKAELKTVLLDHLYMPFGVVLVGNELYLANTDSLVRFTF